MHTPELFRRHTPATALGLMLLLLASCTPTASDTRAFDHAFDPQRAFVQSIEGWDEVIQGSRHLVNVRMKPGADHDALARALRTALKKEWVDSGAWPYGRTELLQPPLREIDFWAFVYADLTHHEHCLLTYETAQERDARIEALLVAEP